MVDTIAELKAKNEFYRKLIESAKAKQKDKKEVKQGQPKGHMHF